MNYKYKVSVIIPVYKVEKYLEETILSVINQSIGFSNIQMILVNDGSPDNSEEICIKYRDLYPDNVVYVKQQNRGVSSARNTGMKYIEGEYVNFLDSDDKFDKKAFEIGIDMLDENIDVNLCCFRIMFFDAKNTPHMQDYKFAKGDRIVDLVNDPYHPMYHLPTVIFRSKIIKNHEFDTRLKVSEDVKFLSEIIVNNKKVGFISSVCYYYRKRKDDSSAIQTSTKNISYYFDTPKYSFEYILDLGKKHKDLSVYMQNVVVSDLQWRIFEANLVILDDKQKNEYIESIRKLLLRCDDNVICNQVVDNPHRIFSELSFKYKKPIYKDLKVKDNYICYKDEKILNIDDMKFEVFIFEIDNGLLKIDALFDIIYNNDYQLFAKVNDKYIKFNKKFINDAGNVLYKNDYEYSYTFFDIEIDLKDVKTIEFAIEMNGKKYKINPYYTKHSKINNCKYSYYKEGKYIVTHKNDVLYVNKKPLFISLRYMFELLFSEKDVLSFGMLMLYHLTYPFVKHDNWIVSDRFDVAGDNGEWMFRYIKENKVKKNVYFGLRKNSKDIEKMEKVGKVINFKSINYYIKYINSEVVISSHIDPFIHKPFGRKQIYLNAFIKRKFVFLQHGIIKEDLSGWLRKYTKNISMFVCSAFREYDSILKFDYMYDKTIVKLTGLPRYDNLLKKDLEKENIIALMPTWRSNLVGPVVVGTQDRGYNPDFKKSEYYKFYNGLISDKRILKVLKEKKYKILFCLHPSMKGQVKDFSKNEFVDIKFYVDYPTIFKKAKLMITDYSSVFFDFSYLKKPIIYAHFDKDIIIQIHSIYKEEGYFSYEDDGFGEVVYDYETAVSHIIKLIENGCKMEDKYVKRVDKFFKYFDDNNCKRVYENILEVLGKENEK